MNLWPNLSEASAKIENEKKKEEMFTAMEEMKLLAMHPSMVVTTGTSTRTDIEVDALRARVKELEGYMPILLDKLEEQHERLEEMYKKLSEVSDLANEPRVHIHECDGE